MTQHRHYRNHLQMHPISLHKPFPGPQSHPIPLPMAMSRFLYQSLPRPPPFLINHLRHYSTKPHRSAHLAETNADADSPEAASAEAMNVGVKRFEEAVHNIIVRRAAPDWLPFLPGYSYWVPPRATSFSSTSPGGVLIEVIGRLTSPDATFRLLPQQELSEDEQMALTSTKGWPSHAFYIEGTSPMHPLPVVEGEVAIQDSEDKEDGTSNSADEEG